MPFSLVWFPAVLRTAGLKVVEVSGWEGRGRGDVGRIAGVICHHTGGSRTGNMGSLNTLRDGRAATANVTALAGPLAQLGLSRDGTYFVIAAGRCNHAGTGIWQGLRNGNADFIGIEAENTGGADDFPWPVAQMDAYQRGVAAILKHIGRGVEFCAGHGEYALPRGRKNDPSFDMNGFRLGVHRILNGIGTPSVFSVDRPILRRGSRGEGVRTLQAKLGIAVDGSFGAETEAAVRQFQRARNLVADGIVGARSWAELDTVVQP